MELAKFVLRFALWNKKYHKLMEKLTKSYLIFRGNCDYNKGC